MMAKKSSPKSLQLGRAVEWPDSPEKAQLDHAQSASRHHFLVPLHRAEFTSICP